MFASDGSRTDAVVGVFVRAIEGLEKDIIFF